MVHFLQSICYIYLTGLSEGYYFDYNDTRYKGITKVTNWIELENMLARENELKKNIYMI